MASVRMIPEEEATGKIADIYEEIKTELGSILSPIFIRLWPPNQEF